MPTVRRIDASRWVVHTESPLDTTVRVEVNMSPETARRISERETRRIAALNPELDDLEPESVGSAVLRALEAFAAGRNL